MREKIDEFAKPITLEMGKLFREAQGEVTLSANILEYYADNADKFLAPEKLPVKEGEAVIENAPLGVLFCIEPWNYPYYQLARVAGPNLMLGNTVDRASMRRMCRNARRLSKSSFSMPALRWGRGPTSLSLTNSRRRSSRIAGSEGLR